MSAPGKNDKRTSSQDAELKSPADQHLCPVCGKVLGLARLSSSGTEFGCRQCGNWFQSDVMRDDGFRVSHAESTQAPRFSPNSIILPLKSATLRDAVDELVPRALHGAGDIFLRSARIAESLKKGIDLRAVEYHRGLAFLHHRLRESLGQRMALGISRNGLQPEGDIENRIFVVALFLRSTREPGYDIPIWARRTMCNDKMIYLLRTAPDVTTVLQVLGEP
ncbi:MAG: hypothetical protein NTY77_06980 [Elusimicrobia bacterium]|nr:hypothetical protein [Elusimicrobiota bacterium]